MALPWIIANLAAGNQPASKLDDNFNALGAIATIPCVATGANAITLTPAALTPAVAAYAQLQAYRAVAAATATGAITARVNALAFLNCYVSGAAAPVAATTGNTVIGDCYDFVYDVALNSGAGGFHIFESFSPVPVVGRFSANKNGTNQTGILSATNTVITFGTAAFNVGASYTAGTSIWVPTTGTWLTTIQVTCSAGIVDQNIYLIDLVRDPAGSPVVVAEATVRSSGTGALSMLITTLVVGNSSDAYVVSFFGGGAGNKTVDGTAKATYWQAFLLANT